MSNESCLLLSKGLSPHLHKSLCLFTALQINSNSSRVDGSRTIGVILYSNVTSWGEDDNNPKVCFYFIFCRSDQRICWMYIQSQWREKQKDVYVNVNLSDIVRRQKQAGIMDMIHFRAQAVMYRFERKKNLPYRLLLLPFECTIGNMFRAKDATPHPPRPKRKTKRMLFVLVFFWRLSQLSSVEFHGRPCVYCVYSTGLIHTQKYAE